MPVKISKQLERSNCSLLSADNSIPEESEDEEEDIEEERTGKLGEEETMSTSGFMEGEEGKRTSAGGEVGEARTSQGSSEDWETESETSCMDVSSSADVTEMEVSVEISGIARRRETKSVSFAVFGALGENEEERVKENDEVVRVNEKEEEDYRKELQFLVEKEAEDEESDEEEEDTS